MAEFQTEYEDSTNAINSIVSTQLSSVLNWINVPGAMTKVSSSASGFAWGFNSSNNLYVCQLPCTGAWTQVDITKENAGTIQDITTDLTNVYVLGSNVLLTAPSTNQGQWNIVTVPFSATKIFSTHTNIWAQDAINNKQKCPKPCMSANWIASGEKDVIITSSSDSSLYGKAADGSAMKTDENLQSGWSPIDGLAKVSMLVGDVDQEALYGVDMSSNPFKFDGTQQPLTTQGYAPLNLTVDPTSKQMWMTTTTSGDKGNIFTRLENPDYGTVTNAIAPIDKSRDQVVSQITKAYSNQTEVMTINKQITDVVNYFKKMFKLDGDTGKKGAEQSSQIQYKIRDTQAQLDQITNIQPILQQLIVILFVALLLYVMLSSIFGAITNVIVLGVIGAGMFYIMNLSNG
jgi:hypothetical protein